MHNLELITDQESYTQQFSNYYNRSQWYMCNKNTYVRQFQVRIEEETWPDDTALNSIKMRCFDNNNEPVKYLISQYFTLN